VKQIVKILAMLLTILPAQAQKFDDFLLSLEKSLPIKTQRLRDILTSTNAKLAHPSLLQKWGIINSTASASYNGVLNTIIVDPELTILVNPDDLREGRRAKTWNEMQSDNKLTFYVPVMTLFHELSHAEFDSLKKSSDPEDKIVFELLNYDLKNYLKIHYPEFNFFQRHIAISELYAYYQGDFLYKLLNEIDDILIDNGYNRFKKTCRLFPHLSQILESLPQASRHLYILKRSPFNYIDTPLPIFYVSGRDLEVNSQNPLYEKLQRSLWNHFSRNYSLPQSRSALVNWMSSQPQYLKLIAPCRTSK
jgi:hypothetical protein